MCLLSVWRMVSLMLFMRTRRNFDFQTFELKIEEGAKPVGQTGIRAFGLLKKRFGEWRKRFRALH